MAVNDPFREHPFCQRMNLVEVVARDHRIEVHFKPGAEYRFQNAKHPRSFNRLVEISGHTAHAVVGVSDAIERDIDVQLQPWIVLETTLSDFVDASRLESVCRKIDVPNPIFRN